MQTRVLLITVSLVLVALGRADEPRHLTNVDVVNMTAAKLPEDVIILTIERSARNDWDLSVEALISLKKANVGDSVIQAMLRTAPKPLGQKGTGDNAEKRETSPGNRERKGVNQDDRVPQLIYHTAPVYPQSLIESNVQGRVVVRFVVDRDGRVTNPRVVSSTRVEFEEPALTAIRQWRFEPGIKSGVVVATNLQQAVNFALPQTTQTSGRAQATRGEIDRVPGRPGTKEASSIVINLINAQANGCIRLISLEKVNGKDGAVFGVQTYTLTYSAQIKFLNDCMWGPFVGTSWSGEFQATPHMPGESWNFDPVQFNGRKATKGTTMTVEGNLHFEKTERGWLGPDRKIY